MLKVAKEKGRGLKKYAKRATSTPRRHSEKDREVGSLARQEPGKSLTTYNEKQPLGKERGVVKLCDTDMEVPHGQLYAIVGSVGAGKSSLV